MLLGPGGTTTMVPDRSNLLRAFAPAAVGAGVLALAVGLLGGWLLAGRVLRPLTEIGRAARLAATGSLSQRIDLAGPHDEFREVADTFDSMLTRIESNVEGYRRFAADASHELRTPLAATRAMIDVAAVDPDLDVQDALRRLGAANDRAVALTEALLLIARTDAVPPVRDDVDLSLVLERWARRSRRPPRRGVSRWRSTRSPPGCRATGRSSSTWSRTCCRTPWSTTTRPAAGCAPARPSPTASSASRSRTPARSSNRTTSGSSPHPSTAARGERRRPATFRATPATAA